MFDYIMLYLLSELLKRYVTSLLIQKDIENEQFGFLTLVHFT